MEHEIKLRFELEDEIKQLRAENVALRKVLKKYSKPIAWMVKSRHGLIRACWSEEPSEEQIAVAHADGDIIIPLCVAPSL